MMRLDKVLSHAGLGTRKEVKQLLKDKRIRVNDSVDVKDKTHIDEFHDMIYLDDEVLEIALTSFIMLHKPKDVITATQDDQHQTVMDCIDVFIGKDMFPVGRLDIDTEGLILICNDGKLAHRLLSPKHHVPKVYEVSIAHALSTQDIKALETGIDLTDFISKPARVEVLDEEHIRLTISEGKFHQIKRMMIALGNEVVYLKRIAMGPLILDEHLQVGQWRYLSEEEVAALRAI